VVQVIGTHKGTGLDLIGVAQVNNDTDASVARRFPSSGSDEPRIG
jgi:hypothetical protein